jgi:hypothetical protein
MHCSSLQVAVPSSRQCNQALDHWKEVVMRLAWLWLPGLCLLGTRSPGSVNMEPLA